MANEPWYIQTVEYYSVLIQMSFKFLKMWMKPRCILLRDGSQSKKTAHCEIPTICHSGKDKTMETVRSVVAE
jgi:hypothetical protein